MAGPVSPPAPAIDIKKLIPIQAGLGGGSADASATIIALARLWRIPMSPTGLASVAASVGADASFFLMGGSALGLGRGDELYPLADIVPHDVVLLVPSFGVSTVKAYSWWDEERSEGTGVSSGQSLAAWPGATLEITNDLKDVVGRRHPGDQANEKRAACGRRNGCDDVGQWVGCVRVVPGRDERQGGAGSPSRPKLDCHFHPNPQAPGCQAPCAAHAQSIGARSSFHLEYDPQ